MNFANSLSNFIGQITNIHCVRADPDKAKAIVDMPPPADTTELRKFLGMANQLGKFSHELVDASAPLRALLRKNVPYAWEQQQRFVSLRETFMQLNRYFVLLWPMQTNYCVRRCIVLRLGLCSHAKTRNPRLETCVLCIMHSDSGGKNAMLNRKRGPRRHVGMRTVFRLPDRRTFRNKNRPRSAGFTIRFKTFGRASSPYTAFPHTSSRLQCDSTSWKRFTKVTSASSSAVNATCDIGRVVARS